MEPRARAHQTPVASGGSCPESTDRFSDAEGVDGARDGAPGAPYEPRNTSPGVRRARTAGRRGTLGPARIEAIAEVFNLFNAKNPSLPFTQRRLLSTGAPNPGFMQPTAYAGDVQQPEQRVGQIGFRVTF